MQSLMGKTSFFCNNFAHKKFLNILFKCFLPTQIIFSPKYIIKNYFTPSGFEPVPNGFGSTPLTTRPKRKNATRKFLNRPTASGATDRPYKVYIFWKPMIQLKILPPGPKPVSGHIKKFFLCQLQSLDFWTGFQRKNFFPYPEIWKFVFFLDFPWNFHSNGIWFVGAICNS